MFLLTDTKRREDAPEQILGGEVAGDFVELSLRLAQIFRHEFSRSIAVVGVDRAPDTRLRPQQCIDVPSPSHECPLVLIIVGNPAGYSLDQRLHARTGFTRQVQGIAIVLLRFAEQVAFAEYHLQVVGGQTFDHLRVGVGDTPVRGHQVEHDVGGGNGLPGAANTLLLDRVVRFTQPRGIEYLERNTLERNMLAQDVARRAFDLGYDRGFVASQVIQQARLSRIGQPGQGDREAFLQRPPVLGLFEQVAQVRGAGFEPLADFVVGQKIDFLLGEI